MKTHSKGLYLVSLIWYTNELIVHTENANANDFFTDTFFAFFISSISELSVLFERIRNDGGWYLDSLAKAQSFFIASGSSRLNYRGFIEEELKKYREELEELVKERTMELEVKNKELNNAMKVFVGRELTITRLEKRIREMEGK